MADENNPDKNPVVDNITDPDNALMQSFINIFTSAEATADVLQESNRQQDELNQQLDATLSRLAEQSGASLERTSEVFDNLDQIERFPRGVTNILGLFDSDFDRDAQILKLEREKAVAQGLQGKKTQIKDAFNVQQKRIKTSADTAVKIHELRTGAFDDQVQLQNLLQDEQQLDINRANLGLSGARFELDQVKDNRARIKFENEQADRRATRALGNLTRSQLEDLLEGKSKTPEGVTREQVETRLNNMREIELNLQTTALALMTNNFELAGKGLERSINSMSSDDLRQLAIEAEQSPDGQVIVNTAVGPVPITVEQAKSGEIAAIERERANATTRDEIALEVMTAQATERELQLKVFAGAGVVSEDGTAGTDLTSALAEYPLSVQTEYAKLQGKITAAANLNNFQIVEETQNAQRTLLETHIEKVIAASPKETRSAKTDYFNNMRLTDAAGATEYLLSSIGNTQVLNRDRTYGPIWTQLAEAVNIEAETSRQSIDATASGAINIVGNEDKSGQAIVARAASSVRADAEATMLQEISSLAIQKMIETPRQAEGPGGAFVPQVSDLFKNLVNPATFQFNEKINKGVGPDAVFDLGALRQELAARTVEARNMGLLQPDQTLNDILLNEVRQITPQVLESHNQSGINKATINFFLFGNSGRGITAQAMLIADPSLVEQDMSVLLENDQKTKTLQAELSAIQEKRVRQEAKEADKPPLFPGFAPSLNSRMEAIRKQRELDDRDINGEEDTAIKSILDFLKQDQ